MRLCYLEEHTHDSIAYWVQNEHLESVLVTYFYANAFQHLDTLLRHISNENKQYIKTHTADTFDLTMDITAYNPQNPLGALCEVLCDHSWFETAEALAAGEVKRHIQELKEMNQLSYVGVIADAHDGYRNEVTVSYVQQRPETREEAVQMIADLTKVWKITAEDITEYLL